MTYRILRGTVMFGAMQLALVAGAQAQTNSLLCMARKTRSQSYLYQCLASCDNKAPAQQTPCDAACQDRHSMKLLSIESRPPCTDVPITPNPDECQALYFQVEANYYVCQSRCANDANPTMCETTCTTRCGTDLDRVAAKPVCKAGPAAPVLPAT